MSGSCPDCGESIEFTDQEVRLRTGACAACGHEFTFVVGKALAPAPPTGEAAPQGAPVEVAGGPECADCGGPLEFQARSDGSIEARCAECETSIQFVPKGAEEAAPRGPRRGREPRREEGEEGPRSRPCRQCGAPLRFSTNEEGLLVGECEACGNRFTLPPRDRFGGRSDRFGGGGRSTGGRFAGDRGRGPYRGPRPRSPSWGRGSRTDSRESGPRDERRRRRRRFEE